MQCRQCHIETPEDAIAQRSSDRFGAVFDVLCATCWESMCQRGVVFVAMPNIPEPEPPNQCGALEWAKYREWQRHCGEANEQLELWRLIGDDSD